MPACASKDAAFFVNCPHALFVICTCSLPMRCTGTEGRTTAISWVPFPIVWRTILLVIVILCIAVLGWEIWFPQFLACLDLMSKGVDKFAWEEVIVIFVNAHVHDLTSAGRCHVFKRVVPVHAKKTVKGWWILSLNLCLCEQT